MRRHILLLAAAFGLAGPVAGQSAAAVLRPLAGTPAFIEHRVGTLSWPSYSAAHTVPSRPTDVQVAPAGFDRLCRDHRWIVIVGSGVVAGSVTYLIVDAPFMGWESHGVWKSTLFMTGAGAGLGALLCVAAT